MAKIFIAQTYEVVRYIEIEVPGTVDQALDEWDCGQVETPVYDDPNWVEKSRKLRVEEAGEVLSTGIRS